MPEKSAKKVSYSNLHPSQVPVPIVAIGGSAGGMEAFTQLLENLPADTGLAYVYIQHLSPNYTSQLAKILACKTAMPVQEAEHLMPIQPNHVYTIPPNKNMEVIDGVLTLMPRKAKPQIHMPVDMFFTSLSKRQKDGAIGIVLSGMANDGTLGLKAIKVAGGITFAQDESAQYSGMPTSAIDEGVVDMVLSPKEIADELARLSIKAEIFKLTGKTEQKDSEDYDDKDLDNILKFMKSTVGVDFDHYKKTTIRRRITRRMLLYKLNSIKEYNNYLKQHLTEPDILYSDLLINVTNFFRDPETMDYLKKEVFPKIFSKRTNQELVRIWIAACSTGQEAYSLAIILTEINDRLVIKSPVQIFATDLSESSIAKARLGTYTPSELSNVSPERIEKYFTKSGDYYRINKEIRDLCVFAPHNLLKDPPFSRIDLISCRNLLIYLDSTLQQKVLATFYNSLNQDGYLVLGKSEETGNSPSYFYQTDKKNKVFLKKNTGQSKPAMEAAIRWTAPNSGTKLAVNAVAGSQAVSINDLDKLVDNLLLSKYMPASVVVNQNLEILQFRGSTSLFLELSPGEPSFNLAKMARPALVLELRNIVHKARNSGRPVSKKDIQIQVNDKIHYVNIEAVPITDSANQQLFLIIFEEVKESAAAKSRSAGSRNANTVRQVTELAALRKDMHAIIEEKEAGNEELQTAIEEIVSSNEELQSINEELEKSKEEIESANEELTVINRELRARNEELLEAYEFAESVLAIMKDPILVLDKDLRVNNASEAYYKLTAGKAENTVGVMFYELHDRQWDLPLLCGYLKEVITKGTSIKGFKITLNPDENNEKVFLIHARKIVQQQSRQSILLLLEDITNQ